MPMSTRQRPVDRGIRISLKLRQMAGEEFRQTRIGLGFSQAFVGRACGLSPTQVSRIERAVLPSVTLEQLCRIASVLGLDTSLKFYAGDSPLRDQAQIDLIERFREHVGPPLQIRTEVPVPIEGDRRAWDMWLVGAPQTVGVEAESRIRDCQAVQRRITLKARDSDIKQVVLLVADSHANRAAVQAAGAILREMFPIPARVALRQLRAGRTLGGWAIVLL